MLLTCTPLAGVGFLAAVFVLLAPACGGPDDAPDTAGLAARWSVASPTGQTSRRNGSDRPPNAGGAQGVDSSQNNSGHGARQALRAARAAAISEEAIASYGGAELPDLDPECEGMLTSLARLDPVRVPSQRGYFDWPIPQVVHQVAGDPELPSEARGSGQAWAAWASQMGWRYRLWQPQDEIAVLTAQEVVLVACLRQAGEWAAAANVVAYHLLAAVGGLYVADNVMPPALTPNGPWADLDRRLPMTGLLLSTHAHFRDVGLCSITATPRFMASAPAHPLMAHLAATVGDNVRARRRHAETRAHPRYLSGAAFLSRNLVGVFHLVTATYLAELHMWPPPFPELEVAR